MSRDIIDLSPPHGPVSSNEARMKRALLVGVDEYDNFGRLSGCVNDVRAVKALLSANEDGSPNFQCKVMHTANGRVERRAVREAISTLFGPGRPDVALLYFAGHGVSSPSDVYLATQDGARGDAGVALSDVLGIVRHSGIPEIIIILDCCFSGAAGGIPQFGGDVAVVRDGLALLAASRGDQTAAETTAHRGAFSTFLCGALEGGAADVLGKITLAGIYSYLSESFGAWDQRPVLKANLDRLHHIRLCTPAVPLADLRRLPDIFAEESALLPLDPSFEPDAEPHDAANEAVFALLQRCRSAKLVEPVGEAHMYYAAINSKACRLTPLGMHYWRMARADGF